MNHMTPRIQAFLDGELSPQQVQMFQDHVNRCAACRRALADAQELWSKVDVLATVPAEVSIWPRLADRLERRRRGRRSWTYRGLAIAATLAGVSLGWQLGGSVGSHGTGAGPSREMSLLEDGSPSLDQLWLQVGVNGGPES